MSRRIWLAAPFLAIPAGYGFYTARRLGRLYQIEPVEDPNHPLIAFGLDGDRFVHYKPNLVTGVIPKRLVKRAPSDQESETEYWSRIFLGGPTLSLEGRLIGSDRQVDSAGRPLVASGLLGLLQKPSSESPGVYCWTMATEPVSFFEKIAAWGYPFRLMSGGRHTLQVLPVKVKLQDGTELVKVTFGCVADYERRNRVTGQEEGKVIPKVCKAAAKVTDLRLTSFQCAVDSMVSLDVRQVALRRRYTAIGTTGKHHCDGKSAWLFSIPSLLVIKKIVISFLKRD